MIWFKDLENNKILSLQFYNILSTYNAKIILFSTHSCTLTTPINYSCGLDNSIYYKWLCEKGIHYVHMAIFYLNKQKKNNMKLYLKKV